MSNYGTAVHEAAHAIVAGSLWISDGRGRFRGREVLTGIRINREGDWLGCVTFGLGVLHPVVSIAGGIAEFRVQPDRPHVLAGMGSDIEKLAKELGVTDDDRFFQMVAAVTCCETPTAALKSVSLTNPALALAFANDPTFRRLADAATTARVILDSHWSTVLTLATTLLQNAGEMGMLELQYFLQRHNVQPVEWDAKNVARRHRQRLAKVKASAAVAGGQG
jgi:hypothetical protein